MNVIPSSDTPILSIVVVVVSDTIERKYDIGILAGCLNALRAQTDLPDFEIIVPYPSDQTSVVGMQHEFPEVCFYPVNHLKTYATEKPGREHHDELRAYGMSIARGEIVALLEDYGRPVPGWGQAMIDAHSGRWVAVGGAIENGINSLVNWGVYFCDFGRYQNPVLDGESKFASDANISYGRDFLNRVRNFWQESFHEPEINWAALASGQKIRLSSKAVVYQYRTNLNLGSAIHERYIWGRSFSATRIQNKSIFHRLLYIVLTPLLPFILFLRIASIVFQKRRNRVIFLKSSLVTALLVACWSAGELAGYLSAKS